MFWFVLNKKEIYRIFCVFIILVAIGCSCFYFTSFGAVITDDVKFNIFHIYDQKEKIAYLTFDDGPTSKVTPKILDILDEFHIKATFFVLGKEVEQNPEIIKRLYKDGHFIANHGYSHNNRKLYKSKESFLNEITKTDQIIGEILNIPDYSSHLFRFPNGSTAKSYREKKKQAIKYLEEIDYTYIDWNVLNNDSIRKYSKKQLLNNLKKSVKNKGSIVVLMHDTGDVNKTYDVLKDSILFLIEEGYTFQNLDELLVQKNNG